MAALADIEIGIGTSAWGNRFMWGFGNSFDEADLRSAYAVISNTTNVLIDTAEIYGMGKSEQYLGQFTANVSQRPVIATKFFPFPWRWSRGTLLDALKRSLARLQTAQVDLYQMHWPFPPVSIETWMRGLVEAAEQGLVRSVGVSNYNKQQMLTADTALAERGLALASNQVRYSLLDRTIEHNGLLGLCHEMGVRVIAYSPLEQGLLTGKYTSHAPPPGLRGARHRHKLADAQPLINTMREIGKGYAEDGIVKTPAQIALNWCICKGTMPIPGAKNARQVQANVGATGWRLAPEDVALLDSLSDDYRRNI
jgi:aryl-alcohol dehydrogenase-like predicted oxidoreductase